MMAVVLMIFMFGGAVPSGLRRKCHILRHFRAGLSRFRPSGADISHFSPTAHAVAFNLAPFRGWGLAQGYDANCDSFSNSKDRGCAGTLPSADETLRPRFRGRPQANNLGREAWFFSLSEIVFG
jgi:hypothetical protein